MGGLINPSSTIGGSAGAPNPHLDSSPYSGLYQTGAGGVGMALGGNDYFELNPLNFLLGFKPVNFTLVNVTGSPFATGNVPYAVAVTPDGAYVLVANRNSNTISVFSMNATTGFLTPVAGSPFASAGSPEKLIVTPNGEYVYCLNEFNRTITAYSINLMTGMLAAVAGSPFSTGNNPHFIAVSKAGIYLFVTNSIDSNISVFSINYATGFLTQVAGSPFATGDFPCAVAVTPDGAHVLVTNTVDSTVSAFSRNATTGFLTPVAGSPFATPRSWAIAITPDNMHVLVTNSISRSVSVFLTSLLPTYSLLAATFDSTGGLGGGFNINGRLQLKGIDVPDQSAITAQIASAVLGLYDDRGNYDASINTFPAAGGSGNAGAILKGDIWTINVAGVLGGTVATIGDTVRALVDAPAQISANWNLLQVGSSYAALTGNIAQPFSASALTTTSIANSGGYVQSTLSSNSFKGNTSIQSGSLNSLLSAEFATFTQNVTMFSSLMVSGQITSNSKNVQVSNYVTLPSGIAVGVSPFTYQNTGGYPGDAIIQGGTVTLIEYSRDGVTYYATGLIDAIVELSINDRVRVTWTVAPIMTFIPR